MIYIYVHIESLKMIFDSTMTILLELFYVLFRCFFFKQVFVVYD